MVLKNIHCGQKSGLIVIDEAAYYQYSGSCYDYLFHWQIMNVQVTIETLREHRHELFVVRCRSLVAVAAGRYQPVFRMTFCTTDLSMFTWRSIPSGVNIRVAGVTGFQVNIGCQGNCPRLVHRVTLHAGGLSLGRKMWFVTFCTHGNITVSAVVATVTCLFCVLAGEFL